MSLTYQVPQLLIQQEFTANPIFAANPLPALIIGPLCPPAGWIYGISLTAGSSTGNFGASYSAGTGYLQASPPLVTIVDPTSAGSGATATATVNSSGVLTAINLVTGGTSYSSHTYCVIDPPPNTAKAYATLDSTGKLSTIVVTNAGNGYASAPAVTIHDTIADPLLGWGTPLTIVSTGSGESATATLINTNGGVASIAVTQGTTVYKQPPVITIAPPAGTQAVNGSITLETVNTNISRPIQACPAGYSYTNYSTGTYGPLPIIGSVTSASQLTSLFGDISYLNPISYALLQALNNSNGVPVYYCVIQPWVYNNSSTPAAIAGTSEEQSYDNALTQAAKGINYYGLVPLTFNQAIQQDIAAHVNTMSAPANAAWRTAWFCNAISSTSSAGTYTSPAYTLATGAYTITTATGTQAEVTAYLLGIQASGSNAISSSNPNSGLRRIHNIFPQTYTDGNGNTVNGYFLCAALAGLRSGSVPHQSLTNTQVIGPSAVPIVTATYSNTMLNQIAAAGVWIITQSPSGGVCYTRHQLTGDNTTYSYREDSVTANVDSISYGLQSALAPFIGPYNITPALILQIRAIIDAELAFYLTGTYTPRAGNQILSYVINSIVTDPANPEMLNITITLAVPYPFNYLTLQLVV